MGDSCDRVGESDDNTVGEPDGFEIKGVLTVALEEEGTIAVERLCSVGIEGGADVAAGAEQAKKQAAPESSAATMKAERLA